MFTLLVKTGSGYGTLIGFVEGTLIALGRFVCLCMFEDILECEKMAGLCKDVSL